MASRRRLAKRKMLVNLLVVRISDKYRETTICGFLRESRLVFSNPPSCERHPEVLARDARLASGRAETTCTGHRLHVH